jgi:hypothetical protein
MARNHVNYGPDPVAGRYISSGYEAAHVPVGRLSHTTLLAKLYSTDSVWYWLFYPATVAFEFSIKPIAYS